MHSPRRSIGTAILLLSLFLSMLPTIARADGERPVAPATVHVERIVVTGFRAIPEHEIRALTLPLERRRMSAGDIESLRHRLTRLYVDRGYVSSGAVLDDPPWRDGSLRLRIIEGRVGEIRTSGLGDLDRRYLAARLPDADTVLHVPDLQARYQLLLADPLFERVDLAIRPGAGPGAAALDVAVVRARPWDVVLFGDNHRSASTGEMQAGVAATVRNLTRHGDALHLDVRGASGGERIGGGWTLPLGDGTTRFGVTVERGDTRIVEAPLDDADVRSRLHAHEVFLEHDLMRRVDRRVTLGLSHATRSVRSSLFDRPFSFSPGEDDGFSRVRVWRLSQTFSGRWPAAVLALRSVFSAGQGNVTAAAGDDAARMPARHFLHWSGQASGQWRPAGDVGWLQARLSVQKAQDRLLPLERFAVGGHATVRGYRENTLVRDNGYAAALEWHWRPDGLPDWLDPFVFHDRGAAWQRDGRRAHLRSIGVGLAADHAGFHAELAWARAIDDRVESAERRLQDRGIHLAVSHAF